MVDLWHPVLSPAGELRIEELGKTARTAPEVHDAVGNTTGLDSD